MAVKLDDMTLALGGISKYVKTCESRLNSHASDIKKIQLSDENEKGQTAGKKMAYNGMTRRHGETRNKILYFVSIAGFCLACVVYVTSVFKDYQANIEKKIFAYIEQKTTSTFDVADYNKLKDKISKLENEDKTDGER